MPSERIAECVHTLVGALIAGTLTLGGCARTMLESSAVDAYAAPEAELEFWDEVVERHVLTNDDALYGLLLTAGGDVPDSYEGRVEAARARGWMGDAEPPPAGESATIGLVAVAVCDLLDVKGGLTMRVFGPSQRYCTRELVFMELLPPRSEYQSLSGLEFVDLLGLVEDRMAVSAPS